jgi:hypothetical protein
MVECDRPLPEGMAAVLDLEEGGRLEAEVRWCQRGQIGLRFAHAFELRRLAPPKPGAGGLKMLTPSYLAPRAEEAEPVATPLAKKSRRG